MPPTAEEEILRPRKKKWVLVLLGGAAFVVGGILMVRHPDSFREKFWGCLCMAFFGFGMVIAILQMIPGSSFLRLSPDGIAVRSLWRTRFYRWSDIEEFGVAGFRTASGGIPRIHRFVGLAFSASCSRKDSAQTLKRINRSLTGYEGALPDNYGWDYGKLAAHLNRWREKYAGSEQ